MVPCLLAFGSNQGDRVGNLLDSLDELRHHPAIRLQRVSFLVETSPVGGPGGQDKYFNAAVTVETELSAAKLLAVLLEIEQKLGRERIERWGPRTIDLDLLLYGDNVIETHEITVPHPRLHERRFVLAPAAEIAADWVHPLRKQTIGQMLAALPPGAPGELGLRVVVSPTDMQATIMKLRRAGRRIGLVPTMGALHEGHLSLVRIARQRADVVVATIFVNPAQFGPKEDLSRYPRTLDADLTALSTAHCDIVFIPTAADMYPAGFSTYLEPPAVAQPLEGVCRPGHFRGVATVVLKLFHLIPADFACFGLKDFQQLAVIRRMVEDLALPIEIVACPTVREADGLAMSSRNRYLSPAERQQALALPLALDRAKQLVDAGDHDAATIVKEMRRILTTAGITRIDYAVLADPETLAEKLSVDGPTVALIAVHVGTTRLIDNRLLNT